MNSIFKRLGRLALSACTILLIAAAVTLYANRAGLTSDHQEAPLVVSRPGSDITDVFMFPAKNPANVVFAMDIHALIPRGFGGGYFFDPGVMYQFKINTNGGPKENKVVQIRAVGGPGKQHLEFYGPATPGAAGTQSRWEGSPQAFPFNKSTQLQEGVTVFAGPRKDPFFLDLAQLLKILPDRNAFYHQPGVGVPPPSAKCFRTPGVDFFRDYNVLSLVAELPRRMFTGTGGTLGVIHMYATTSLASDGGSTFTQIERTARPAIKETFEVFADHDRSNRSTPWGDTVMADSIASFTTSPKGAGRSAQIAAVLRKVLVPDELTADLTKPGPAAYLGVETGAANFGGRGPSTVVIDPSLAAVFGNAIPKLGLAPDDGHETPCLTSNHVPPDDRGVTTQFPYLGTPI